MMRLVLMLAFAGACWGACGGSSPNRVAADATRTEVAACVTAATTGDTITVPSGTQTWASAITLQIGLAKDNSQWDETTTPAWDQEIKPAYFWGNYPWRVSDERDR